MTQVYFIIYHRDTMEYGHYQSLRIEATCKGRAAELANDYYERIGEDPIIVDGVIPAAEWRTW